MPPVEMLNEDGTASGRDCFVPLEDLAGDSSLGQRLAKYLAPESISADGQSVMCLPMREARNHFSAKGAAVGARVFLPTKGENANVPLVLMTVEQLNGMIREAESEAQAPIRSLAAALAPSADLPPAAPLRVKGGSFTSEPRLLARKRALAD